MYPDNLLVFFQSNMKIDSVRSITLITCMLVVLGVFSRELYVPLLPKIGATLPGNHFYSTSIITATILGIGISLFFYGFISDYIGRKITLIFGISIALIATLASAFVTSSFALFVMQIFSGLGIGACVVISRAILRDKLEGDHLTRAVSYQSMASSIFPMFAPLCGAFLQEAFGWRSAFIFFACTSALMLIFIYFYLPETNKNRKKIFHHKEKILHDYFSVLKNKFFINYALLLSFSFLPLLIYALFSPFVFQIQFHLSVKSSAIFYGITAIGYFFGSFFTNRFCHKIQAAMLIRVGLYFSFIAALVMLILAILRWQNAFAVCIPEFFLCIGCGILTPAASKECIQPFPAISGSATALVYSVRMLIPVLFAGLFSWIGVKTQLSMALYIFATTTIIFLYHGAFEKIPWSKKSLTGEHI